jgi:hypothetical protein
MVMKISRDLAAIRLVDDTAVPDTFCEPILPLSMLVLRFCDGRGAGQSVGGLREGFDHLAALSR